MRCVTLRTSPLFSFSVSTNMVFTNFLFFDQCHMESLRWWNLGCQSSCVWECEEKRLHPTSWSLSVQLQGTFHPYWLRRKLYHSFTRCLTSGFARSCRNHAQGGLGLQLGNNEISIFAWFQHSWARRTVYWLQKNIKKVMKGGSILQFYMTRWHRLQDHPSPVEGKPLHSSSNGLI